MTVTTAPVKSFDSLRECASNERVTTNRKPKAAKTLARIMMMSQIKVVVAPITRSSIARCQRAYTSTQLSARRVEFTTEAHKHREGYSKKPQCLCGEKITPAARSYARDTDSALSRSGDRSAPLHTLRRSKDRQFPAPAASCADTAYSRSSRHGA